MTYDTDEQAIGTAYQVRVFTCHEPALAHTHPLGSRRRLRLWTIHNFHPSRRATERPTWRTFIRGSVIPGHNTRFVHLERDDEGIL